MTDAADRTLSVHNVTKRFKGLTALDSVSFEAFPSRVTSVIGPNGAGKTTLFNVMTGFLRRDGGQVMYGPHRLTGMSPSRITKLGVMRTFQDVRIFARLTVDENLRVGATGDGARWARELLAEFSAGSGGLDPNEIAGSLAYGQQKLVAIARGVAARADAFLLDEPAAGLDDESLHVLAEMILRLRANGKLVLLVEHKMDFVMSLSDEVVVLTAGRVLAKGTPAEIQVNDDVVAAYLGTAHTHGTPA